MNPMPHPSIACLQPALSGRQMADASAKAADAAYDRVADAETSRDREQAGASVQQAQSVISDAVLHQRTYFAPTMVSSSTVITGTQTSKQSLSSCPCTAGGICFGFGGGFCSKCHHQAGPARLAILSPHDAGSNFPDSCFAW